MDGFVPSYNLQVAVSALAVEALRQRQSSKTELKQGWAPPSMGFFATIGRGWEMSKLSMSVVKKDPELMVYMIISGVMSLACLIGMSMPQFLKWTGLSTPTGPSHPLT